MFMARDRHKTTNRSESASTLAPPNTADALLPQAPRLGRRLGFAWRAGRAPGGGGRAPLAAAAQLPRGTAQLVTTPQFPMGTAMVRGGVRAGRRGRRDRHGRRPAVRGRHVRRVGAREVREDVGAAAWRGPRPGTHSRRGRLRPCRCRERPRARLHKKPTRAAACRRRRAPRRRRSGSRWSRRRWPCRGRGCRRGPRWRRRALGDDLAGRPGTSSAAHWMER